MKTFNKELKQHWIDVMQAHQDADRLIQGEWLNTDAEFYEGEEFHRGCFFDCAIQTDEDALERAVEAMQLPAWLVYLAKKIYEGLPKDEALLFPVQLLKAVPTDTDISEVRHRIAVKRLEPRLQKSNGNDVNNAIKQVIEYHKNTERTEDERLAARSAADLAADLVYSVSFSAVSSAVSLAASLTASSAASSASSAASSASLTASSAASSASSAVSSAVSSAASSAAWVKERDNLLQALQEQ